MSTKKKWISALLIAALSLNAGCAKKPAENEKNNKQAEQAETEEKRTEPLKAQTIENLQYGDSAFETYDLYIPEGLDTTTPQPLVLWIHGGGWISGDKKSMEQDALFSQANGYISASMNYDLLLNEGASIDTMLDDITACMQSIQKELQSLGIKVDETALGGFSAGGHLAMLYGYTKAEQSPLPIRFIFEKSGIADFHPESWGDSSNSQYLQFFQGDEEFIETISPIYHVTPKAPPTIILQGENDQTVGNLQGSLINDALNQNNVVHDFYYIEGASHHLQENQERLDQAYQSFLEYARAYF